MDLSKCPWCGVEATSIDDERGYAEWGCGSFKHGVKPWQGQACVINELEAQLETLHAIGKIISTAAMTCAVSVPDEDSGVLAIHTPNVDDAERLHDLLLQAVEEKGGE